MTSLVVGRPVSSVVRVFALLGGFGAAIALRIMVGGVAVRDSSLAGLLFAVAVAGLAWAAGVRARIDVRALIGGALGAAIMCAPLSMHGELTAHRPGGSFTSWAVVVVVVALAEEAFLRGALYDAVFDVAGAWAAVFVGGLCFAALHVPMYGWTSVPLDFAVGLLLGALRWVSGNWLTAGVAHVAADIAAWWLR